MSVDHHEIFPSLGGVIPEATPLGMRALGDDGPPVVLVHGIARCASTWSQVALPLSASHRVLLPDNPGMGLSREVPVPRTIEAHGELLAATLRPAAERAPLHLVGLSMGGMIAIAAAARLGRRCASLTVIASSSLETGLFRLSAPALLRIFGRLLRIRRGDHRLNMAELVGAETLARWPGLAERLDAAQREEGVARGATGRQFWACARFRARPFRGRLPPRRRALVGDADRFVPRANSRRLARLLDMPLSVLEGVGHDVSLDAPERMVQEIAGWIREEPGELRS